MQNRSQNTFTELNTDSHKLNTRPNVMVDAINATLTTKGKNQLILQNLDGNELISLLNPGYQPLGVTVYKDIAYIISGLFDSAGTFVNGEIGTYPSPDWNNLFLFNGNIDPERYLPIQPIYSALRNFSNSPESEDLNDDSNYDEPFRTKKLNFKNDRLIEIEVQPSYDESVNIIFTDNYNSPRLVNSRFKMSADGKSAALADRRQSKDTNTYAKERFGAIKLLRQSDKIVNMTFDGVLSGGFYKGGGYRYYFKYIDSDGSLTDIIEESRLVSISYNNHGATENQITNKCVSFTFVNLDHKFSGIKVYYSFASGDTDVTTIINEVVDIYDLPSDSSLPMNITLYGDENVKVITYDELNSDYSSIDTVKTISQFDDRLVLGNITNVVEKYENLRLLSQKLVIKESNRDMFIKELGGLILNAPGWGSDTGYANPNNVYNYLGVWSGETYEVAIVYILKDGKGTTPAFPIRGGDNYNNDLVYTNNMANPNGFVGTTTENVLGVYRTSKDKVLLKGPYKNATEIKYLNIDINDILGHSDLTETAGFFFVRRERKKDALAQGFFTNTCEVPLQTSGDGIIRYQQNPKVGIGYAVQGVSCKVLPAPGRWWEGTVMKNTLGLNVGFPLSIQGKVLPNPAIIGEGNYAFYSPDQLVNKPLFASVFNGINKSINLSTSSPIIGRQHVIDHYIVNTAPGVPGYPYTWGNEFFNPMNQLTLLHTGTGTWLENSVPPIYEAERSFLLKNTFIELESSPASDINIKIQGVLHSKNSKFLHYNFDGTPCYLNIEFDVDSLGILRVGGVNKVSGECIYDTVTQTYFPYYTISKKSVIYDVTTLSMYPNLTLQKGAVLSADFQPPSTVGALPGVGTFTIKLSLPIYDTQQIAFGNTTYTTPILVSTDVVEISGTYVVNTKTLSTGSSVTLSVTGDTPIQEITLDNFNLSPEPLSSTIVPIVCNANFIPEDQEAFSYKQFASKSTGSMIYVMPMLSGYSSIFGHGSIFATDQIKFSDYIGIHVPTKPDKLITDLRNDSLSVFNVQTSPTNANNYAGSDLADWTYKVEDEGFRLAVVGNIYDSTAGVMSRERWKLKYNNNSYIEPYYAITKRKTWDDAAADTIQRVFDGDCYINYTYKRLNYAIGIEGAPDAHNPALYPDIFIQAGLYNKGTVMPMVCEGNYNTALRNFEFKDAVEKTLYGKDRTFYPVDSIASIRASRQPESAGYNHGYNYNFSDRNYVSLNDRSPILNINYNNRVMVSETSISSNFTNGYTDFSGLNFRDYNKQLGEITKLIAHNNNLFCIFEKGIGVVPMNQRTMVSEAKGGVFIDDAKVLAQKMQIISTEYGSAQQFSIKKTDEFVYGCDLNKNKIWKITSSGEQHGLELISDFAIQVILNDFKNRLDINSMHNVVVTNYDRERNNVIFSFLSKDKGKYNTNLYSYVQPPAPITTNQRILNELPILPLNEDNSFTMENGRIIYPVINPTTQGIDPVLISEDNIGSVYYNETVGKWISRLSWNPLFAFNISNKFFSFNATNEMDKIWKHFSDNVPYCNFYGRQDKFEFEFVLVDNPTNQKILNNLHFICNRTFPGRVIYTLDKDTDFETFGTVDDSNIDLLRQRHEEVNSFTQVSIGGNIHIDFGISYEEAERLSGAYFVYNNIFYILGNVVIFNNINYIVLKHENGSYVLNNIAGLIINRLEFGIIKQNMEYNEDHLYIEVGKSLDKSRVRDKAISIRLVYEGQNYITIQSIISLFVYSFN